MAASDLDDAIVVCMQWVYILRCADGSLYVGETSDLDSRLAKHNEGIGYVEYVDGSGTLPEWLCETLRQWSAE